jgi:maltose-binding protein MalE
MPAEMRHRLQTRAWAAAAALALIALQGCGLNRRSSLFVYEVPSHEALSVIDRTELARMWSPLLNSYRQIDPQTSLEIMMFPERRIEAELRRRQARGLGPDLIVLSGALAVEMYNKGLLRRVNLPPYLEQALEPEVLGRVRVAGGYAALPVARAPEVSCYNRQRIPRPPTTLAELLVLAASGRHVGLSLSPLGIWWSAGSLGADEAMARLLTRQPGDTTAVTAADRQAIERWLGWLRYAARQNHVNFFDNPQDVNEGFLAGHLDWIPCSSLSLRRFKDRLGNRLGVAPLPAGPGGPPSAGSPVRVVAFGLNSSATQHRKAMDLVLLSLNPLVQRALSLSDQEVLPVNRYAPPPVASSAILEALVRSQDFIKHDSLQGLSLSTDEFRRITGVIDRVLTPLVVGLGSVRQTADQLIQELPPR